MAKYAFLGGYKAETWAHLVANPGDRQAAIQKAAERVGARVETLYWSFGDDDFLVIGEAPDDTTAAAFAVGVASSGALRNIRTVKLITTSEMPGVLAKAKDVAGAYVPPGARQPVGVN